MTTLYDNTFFKGKPPAPGVSGWGCIPGATQLELWKPSDPADWHKTPPKNIMAHVEEWTDIPYGLTSKQNILRCKSVLDELVTRIKSVRADAVIWWYAPTPLRSDFLYAIGGNKESQRKVKVWKENVRMMIDLGLPGTGLGVCVDMYDYTYLSPVWLDRLKTCISPWIDAGIKVMPTLYLRWLDSGDLWTSEMARTRTREASALCEGRCAVHDGYKHPGGAYEQYAPWPLRETVESIARGD